MSKGAGFDFTKSNSLVIAYTSLDFTSMLADLQTYAKTQFSDTWTDFNKGSFDYMWLNILAYVGDLLVYSINTGLNETNILTCKRLRNFMRMAPAYNYYLLSTFSSKVSLTIKSSPQAIPYVLPYDTFKVSGNNIVFMPEKNTLITSITQAVAFVSGELFTNQLIGLSSGLKSQTFVINDTPIVEGSIRVFVGNVEWTFTDKIPFAKSEDLVYFRQMSETGHMDLIFGDNINGKIPPQNSEIRATYRVGGGSSNNVGKNVITTILTPLAGVVSVYNTSAAVEGVDILPLAKAKAYISGAVTTNNRAVTLEDHVSVLFDARFSPPAGIEKASIRLVYGVPYVFVIASGNQPISDALKSAISKFYKPITTRDAPPIATDATYINLQLTIGAFVDKNYNSSEIIANIRKLLITESDNVATGIFDYANLGLGGRDDSGTPQITLSRIQQTLDVMKDKGLQKVSIEKLTVVPVSKTPVQRTNVGNGYVKDIIVSTTSVRREFVIRWKTSTVFNLYQRIVGVSTLLTDNQMLDDRLDISKMGGLDAGHKLYAGARLNPNRAQYSSVPIDVDTSLGSVIFKLGGVNTSLFSLGAEGDEYYIEFLDTENAVMPAEINSELNVPVLGGVCRFTVATGTVPFSTGDEISFDLYPLLGDIILREDEMPQFEKNDSNVAVDLIVLAKTAE